MQPPPEGWVRDATPSSLGLARSRRWAWTYKHGMPLLIASIVAVVVSGSGLVTVLLLSDGEPSNNQITTPTSTPASTPTGPQLPCEVGTWHAVEIEEDITTGILEWAGIGDPPVFIYREDGTGSIDFGERTTFTFHDRIFRDSTHQFLTGEVQFEYHLTDDTMRHVYVNVTDGARMIADPLPIPNPWYVPAGDTFTFECDSEATVSPTAPASGQGTAPPWSTQAAPIVSRGNPRNFSLTFSPRRLR
jgi:hypothetical protein